MDERESSRLRQFRQLKKEIRGSERHLIVGIDVGKDKHHAFFGTATGKTVLKRLVFDNAIDGFEKLLRHVEADKMKQCAEEVVFGLEPTANYHKPLGEFLIKCDREVVLVAGGAVKNNREMLDGRWDKNDTKDPANIADLISQGKFLYYDYPCEALRGLRELLALKRVQKEQEHRVKVRIRNNLLAKYFPELERSYGKWGPEILSIVKWCIDPAVIAGMEYEEFVRLVAPGCRGVRSQKERLRAIWEKAIASIGCDAGECVDFEAKMMVKELHQLREAIRETDDEIEKVCLEFPEYSYLLTIPGFGPDVSSKVLGYMGDPSRFENRSQVVKMAGFDLSASRSGKRSDNVVPVISKKGKADLRYALYQAALIASTRDRYFMVYFTNKLRGREREKGIKTKMRVKLAAKMLVIAWTLMKKQEPFDPSYLKNK
jgi:transposase